MDPMSNRKQSLPEIDCLSKQISFSPSERKSDQKPNLGFDGQFREIQLKNTDLLLDGFFHQTQKETNTLPRVFPHFLQVRQKLKKISPLLCKTALEDY